MRTALPWLAFVLFLFMVADFLDLYSDLERRVTRLELKRAGLSADGPWAETKDNSNA